MADSSGVENPSGVAAEVGFGVLVVAEILLAGDETEEESGPQLYDWGEGGGEDTELQSEVQVEHEGSVVRSQGGTTKKPV